MRRFQHLCGLIPLTVAHPRAAYRVSRLHNPARTLGLVGLGATWAAGCEVSRSTFPIQEPRTPRGFPIRPLYQPHTWVLPDTRTRSTALPPTLPETWKARKRLRTPLHPSPGPALAALRV